MLQEFTFQCFFRHFWRDKRLAFEDRLTQLVGDQEDSGGGLGDGGVGSNETIETLMLNSIMLSRVWKPDTFFRGNGQNSYIHDITRPNQLFRLNRKGEINFSTRSQLSIPDLQFKVLEFVLTTTKYWSKLSTGHNLVSRTA